MMATASSGAPPDEEELPADVERWPVRRRVLWCLWRQFVRNLQGELLAGFESVEKDFEAAMRSRLPTADFPDTTDHPVWTSRINVVNRVVETTKSEILDFEHHLTQETVRSYYPPPPLLMTPPSKRTKKRKR